MAEEIDESGFYREDFSTVSDWEIFNAQLGEVFQKWSLSDIDYAGDYEGDLFRSDWSVKTEILELLKSKIAVSYYISSASEVKRFAFTSGNEKSAMYSELMVVKNTFGPPLPLVSSKGMHTIPCVYGLSRFVVIHPPKSHQQFLSNPAELCFFLSAATIVAAESCSMIPIFVQIYDPKWNFFIGVGINSAMRTNFDIVALKQSPVECRYLSGLLTIFKEKIPSTNLCPITVSVRNTYALETVRLRIPMNVPFSKCLSENSEEMSKSELLNVSQFIALPCGYFRDAGTDVYLVYSWTEISENVAIDSPILSDFVPSKAKTGSMYQVAHAVSYLTSCLRDFLKTCEAKDTLESFVGRNFSNSGADMSSALQQLTDPHFGHIRAYKKPGAGQGSVMLQPANKVAGPLTETELNEFLAHLFPDLHPDIAHQPYLYTTKGKRNEFDPHRIKSALLDSLTSRLSCLLATCNAHFGGKSGLAQLWAAFIKELRFIWDVRLAIPGVTTDFPDTRTCLLNQKLQMLNYCIERSKLREYGNKNDTGSNNDHISDDDSDTPESKNDDGIAEEAATETGEEDDDDFYDCTEYGPEGRARRLGDMKLLDCDEHLYVPITQDPVPKTEDQLQADAEAMLKLGPGSDLTMQMMCPSLLSDMEAFKAANPKSRIEDFIRWYSPKDWEEDEDCGNGKLSTRMQTPGNTWQEVWQQAQPVPVSRQKRLFDESIEALKVLNYLETRNISEIYELTIIPLLHAAILKFKDIVETEDVLDIFDAQVEALFANLCHLSRDIEMVAHGTDVIQKTPNPEGLIRNLEVLETQFYQYKCFERLSAYPDTISFAEIKQKFQEMLRNENSCSITSHKTNAKQTCRVNEGGLLKLNLDNELRDYLIIKEYVLRVHGETNSSAMKDQVGPQFLRAIVTGEEIRLCGAFTENTTLI